MLGNLDGLGWLLLLLGPLLILQRGLHREVQALFLVATRRPDISIALFSLLFFPGVLLHEGSHYLMARLLGVRTGRFSLLPRPMGDGRLQLGFVETAPSDWLRDALIGAAPLLAGGLFVAYAGLNRMGLMALWETVSSQGQTTLPGILQNLFEQPDFWLWFYLTLTVSGTMLPSAADRRAWVPLGLIVALLLATSLLAGAGPWMLEHLAGPLNRVLRAVSVVFGISALVHLVLLLPVWALRCLLSWATGVQVA
ncbi:MAG: hypothetical protein JXA78_12595 [Anaerolineales bacterium]|nr:hypothetical protein [Anaerolineales bacterium]